MNLKVNTEVLKELVSKAVKGVGNNKLIPLTSLMLIKLENTVLTIVTTDATNYLYVKKDKVTGEDFYVVVKADQFSKLISKMTSENVELEVKSNSLEVRGNGTYQIDIPLDEGEFIQYPDPLASLQLDENSQKTVQLSTINTVLSTCKPSLAMTMETPVYTGYYCGESVVTTDNYTMASLAVNVFGTPVLVTPEYMDLLGLMSSEEISSYITGNDIVCTTPECTVYGKLMEGVEDFPIEGINTYINQNMDSSCKVSKNALLSLLDRISLFVGTYDDEAIRLTFANDGIKVESKQSNGIETVPYLESSNFQPFTQLIDVKDLIEEVKAYPEDAVSIQYGADKILKMTSGNITFIVCYLQEANNTEE